VEEGVVVVADVADNAGRVAVVVVVVGGGGIVVESESESESESGSREGAVAGDVVAGSATYPRASCGWVVKVIGIYIYNMSGRCSSLECICVCVCQYAVEINRASVGESGESERSERRENESLVTEVRSWM
jgi:hypothetical protein